MKIENMTEAQIYALCRELLCGTGEMNRKPTPREDFPKPPSVLELEPLDNAVWHRSPMKHRGVRPV